MTAYLHEAVAPAESDHAADQFRVDLVEEEVEPGDVVVVDDVEAVLDPGAQFNRISFDLSFSFKNEKPLGFWLESRIPTSVKKS